MVDQRNDDDDEGKGGKGATVDTALDLPSLDLPDDDDMDDGATLIDVPALDLGEYADLDDDPNQDEHDTDGEFPTVNAMSVDELDALDALDDLADQTQAGAALSFEEDEDTDANEAEETCTDFEPVAEE